MCAAHACTYIPMASGLPLGGPYPPSHIYPSSNFNVTYPLISSSDHAANNVVTTNLCLTQLLIGHLKHAAWLIFHVKALEYCLPPNELCKYLSFHMNGTCLSVCLLPFKFACADVQFDNNAYPEMWKFWQNHDNDRTPSWMLISQNMSEQCQS